jgi:hypothetical protein
MRIAPRNAGQGIRLPAGRQGFRNADYGIETAEVWR